MVITKGKLKAKLLEHLREMEKSGSEIIITDHNRPVGKIIPYNGQENPDELFLPYRGLAKYNEDILKPTTEEWTEV